jgi:hypothetical protein
MAPRHLSATLGLIAAAAAIGFIMVRVLDAAAPAATPVTLANTGLGAVSVAELSVVGTQPPLVLKGPWTLAAAPLPALAAPAPASASASAASAAGPAVPYVNVGSLTLSPGRPLELAVQLQAPLALRQTCTLEPRPPGDCALSVAVSAREVGRSVTSSVACTFECKAVAPVTPP